MKLRCSPIRDAQERLAFYVKHRLAREAKVLAALRSYGAAAALTDLVPIAYADTPQAAWPFARLAIEAHLVKLMREGHAAQHEGKWVATTKDDGSAG